MSRAYRLAPVLNRDSDGLFGALLWTRLDSSGITTAWGYHDGLLTASSPTSRTSTRATTSITWADSAAWFSVHGGTGCDQQGGCICGDLVAW